MFRVVIRPSFRFIPQKPIFPHASLISSFSISQSRYKQDEADDFNKDPDAPPRLFVIQPRFRPDSLLNIKLDEALNLANSLEQQRHWYDDHKSSYKLSTPHIVVQNPAYRSTHAGLLNLFISIGVKLIVVSVLS